MNFLSLLFLTTYTTIIVSLVWARFKFFRIESKSSELGSRLYDPIVVIQIITTIYFSLNIDFQTFVSKWIGCALYIVGVSLFLWAITTAKHLNFAFSDNVDSLVTTGPYGIIRHPIYFSYIIIWFSSTLVFNSLILWITLIYLVAFYILSARKEEEVILNSEYSGEYREYRKK